MLSISQHLVAVSWVDLEIFTCNRHPVDVPHRAWQRTNKAGNHSHNGKDNRASPVACDRVEQHREGQYMTGHQKDNEQKLADFQKLAPESAQQELARITHVVEMRVAQFELRNDNAGIP